MFDHVTLKISRFSKSLAFYRAALTPLGLEAQQVDEAAKSAGFGPQGNVGLWLAEGQDGGPVHLAFKAADRAAVGRFFEAALAAGGKDNGKPGVRPDYSAKYYAAFVLDPDGNNIEAVTFASK
jgi:catechol 2,3-dioxygenase-like lactoylglutathione lyase family enzyme